MPSFKSFFLSVLLWLMFMGFPASAQEAPFEDRGQPIQVFVSRDIDDFGTDRLYFVDSLTGLENTLEVNGERYMTVGRQVIFFDLTQNQVVIAGADGRLRGHPFIQPNAATRRIDWVVSEDGEQIAWTLTDANELGQFITATTVANLDGTGQKQLLVDGPRDGIRAMPVAFNRDHSLLYMDYQPDGISNFTPFQQYAGLFSVDIETQTVEMLPDEPGCYCGAGVGGGKFLRMSLNADLTGFDYTIDAEVIPGYTQAGGVVISPDGARAVYALGQVTEFNTPNQFIRTIFMLVDLENMTQMQLTQPITSYVLPHSWTEDDSAIIFTSPETSGTWKISVEEGVLDKIADVTYIGTLRS
jgi:hypothetical protein